jgi:hypothetical protein
MLKRTVLLWMVMFVVGLYTTFVLQSLWNWFAVEAFHLAPISFWLMYGLMLTARMFTSRGDELPFFEELTTRINACMSEEKRELVNNEIEHGIWAKTGRVLIGEVSGSTVSLGIGAVVHILLV